MKPSTHKRVCDVCGSRSAEDRRIARSYGKGDSLLVIENVPLISCHKCGASYHTAEVMHELERIRLHRSAIAVKRRVAVAAFA